MRHRRPRGPHCVADACPSCAMRANGLPGVTTCVTPLRAGDRVERERGTPSADRDVLGALDRVSALAPAGFRYRRFRRSPGLHARWERVLAHLAGTGALPDLAAAGAGYAEGVLGIASSGGLVELRPGAVVLASGAHERPLAADLHARGVEVLAGTAVRGSRGRTVVSGADLAAGGTRRTVACDAIAVCNGRRPARELLLQRAATGGLALRVAAPLAEAGADPARPAVPGWWLAGAVAGTAQLADVLQAGAAAGSAAARS